MMVLTILAVINIILYILAAIGRFMAGNIFSGVCDIALCVIWIVFIWEMNKK